MLLGRAVDADEIRFAVIRLGTGREAGASAAAVNETESEVDVGREPRGGRVEREIHVAARLRSVARADDYPTGRVELSQHVRIQRTPGCSARRGALGILRQDVRSADIPQRSQRLTALALGGHVAFRRDIQVAERAEVGTVDAIEVDLRDGSSGAGVIPRQRTLHAAELQQHRRTGVNGGRGLQDHGSADSDGLMNGKRRTDHDQRIRAERSERSGDQRALCVRGDDRAQRLAAGRGRGHDRIGSADGTAKGPTAERCVA